MRIKTRWVLCLMLFGVGAAAAQDPQIPHEKYVLPNGLEVILHQDNRIPVVAVNIWYHVGAGDEQYRKSGFAHLFEHMLFQGSAHVGSDQHFATLRSIGGTGVNGSTNSDRTDYYETVPSHELETALWLESDRMGFLLPMLTEESLRNQIDVVRNERRQRIDTVPYGTSRFAMAKALYPETHPYRYLVIGRHEDLQSSTLEDVVAFYRKWYVPANATLVLAGDFEVAVAKTLVRKWFGDLPSAKKPERRKPPTPKIQVARQEVRDEFAKLPRITHLWHTPAFHKAGDAEFDVLADALGRTGTGRLYKRLVHEAQLAQSVQVYQASKQWSSVFTVSVTAKSGADLRRIERIMEEEVEKLRRTEMATAEFKRAVVAKEAGQIWRLQTLMARASTLQSYNHYLGKPDSLSEDLDRMRLSSPKKVREFASRFLSKEKRAVVVTMPQGGQR